MNKNYFAIERNGKCLEDIVIKFDDSVAFEDLMNMSYEEMKSYDDIEKFVAAVMDATSDLGGEQLVVNLVGPDDVFIWGIIIGIYGDDYNYVFVDWHKDGKNYRYEKK